MNPRNKSEVKLSTLEKQKEALKKKLQGNTTSSKSLIKRETTPSKKIEKDK